MSIQEHHKRKDKYVKSKAPRKKGSICQFKSTTKERINMSNQEHHERKDRYVSSRAPRKKGSIYQFKSTTKKRINDAQSNVPQPSHICVIANHFDCNVRR